MGRQVSEDSESRFARYVEGLTSVIGHADRALPLRDYCVGLLAAEGRKSVEPMAAVTAPAAVSAQHQKLLHFVAEAPWSDERVLAKVREMVVPAIARHGPMRPGLLMIRLTPSRAPTRSACIISIADSLASRPIVRWW
jgi:SRSO17 transposase